MFLLEKPPVQQVLTIQMKWARLLLSAVTDVLITMFMSYNFFLKKKNYPNFHNEIFHYLNKC